MYRVQTVFTLSIVINRAKHTNVTNINKRKYMLMCNHKIRINIMLCPLKELRTQNSECLFRYKCKAIIIFVTNK